MQINMCIYTHNVASVKKQPESKLIYNITFSSSKPKCTVIWMMLL